MSNGSLKSLEQTETMKCISCQGPIGSIRPIGPLQRHHADLCYVTRFRLWRPRAKAPDFDRGAKCYCHWLHCFGNESFPRLPELCWVSTGLDCLATFKRPGRTPQEPGTLDFTRSKTRPSMESMAICHGKTSENHGKKWKNMERCFFFWNSLKVMDGDGDGHGLLKFPSFSFEIPQRHLGNEWKNDGKNDGQCWWRNDGDCWWK